MTEDLWDMHCLEQCDMSPINMLEDQDVVWLVNYCIDVSFRILICHKIVIDFYHSQTGHKLHHHLHWC